MNHNILEMSPGVEASNTGIKNAEQLATSVAASLADTYVLMVKTQAYHWNVVGPLFYSVHNLTEEHYNDLFKAVDEIAERIRALGYPAPTNLKDMVEISEISEDTGNTSTEEMIANLADDHETAAKRFRKAVEIAEENRDVVTADMLTARMAFHEKAAWMFKALLTK